MQRGRWLWIIALVVFLILSAPRVVGAAEGGGSSAKDVSLGKNVSSQLTETYPERYFQFSLPSSGRVVLHASSYAERTNYRIYDPSGNLIWRRENVKKSDGTGKSRIDETIDLKGGTYVLLVDSKYLLINRYYGKFIFRINYTPAKETFAETSRSEEPGMAKAPAVSFDAAIHGQISANEDQDIFRFTVSKPGIVTLTAKIWMQNLWYNLYDANGTQIYVKHMRWNAKNGVGFFTADLALLPGSYYLTAAKDRSTGPYAFRLSFKSTAVTFPETAKSQNNSTESASRISLGKTVRGLIALNNEADYYRFKLSTGKKIRIQAAAYMKYISYKIINSRGETVWSSTPLQSSASGKSRIDETASLAKGTYYFIAKKVGDNTGRYLYKLS